MEKALEILKDLKKSYMQNREACSVLSMEYIYTDEENKTNEAIAELKECCEIYSENFKTFKKAHEAELKAKDEEIERLKRDLTAFSMLLDEPTDTKARSIVAMLFKHWKHYSRIRCRMYSDDTIQTSKTLYKKAYAMLKDKQ